MNSSCLDLQIDAVGFRARGWPAIKPLRCWCCNIYNISSISQTDWPSNFGAHQLSRHFAPPPDPFVPPRFPENLGEALELAKRHQGLTLALLLGILLYLAIAIYISLWVSRVITERLVKKTSWCRGSAVFAPKRLRMHGGVGVFVLALWPICGTSWS